MNKETVAENFRRLVGDRIESLDHPRKTSLLRLSFELKPQGLTVLPFPEFNSAQGRRLVVDEVDDKIGYTRSDALNMLMALAGNDESGDLRKGSLEREVKSDPVLVEKIKDLVNKMEMMPAIDDIEDEHLFQNELTDLNVNVPKKYTKTVVNLPLGDEAKKGLISQGYIVPIGVALDVIGQVVDQLDGDSWTNPETGEVTHSDFAGLIGCFYDKNDAEYLAKMLKNFIN